MKNKDQKKKKMKSVNRRGIVLIAVLAMLILLVNIISFSYSWFQPRAVDGRGVKFDEVTRLRSEDCTFETYKGHVVTAQDKLDDEGKETKLYGDYFIDQIKYEPEALEDLVLNSAPDAQTDDSVTKVTIPKAIGSGDGRVNGRVYFRTNIQNNSTEYPSVVSLYAHSMPAGLMVACTSPSNTVRFVGDSAKSDYYIIRNAYVKVKNESDVDGPGLLSVEWFIENTTDDPIDVKITATCHTENGKKMIDDPGLYLMYN